jgi:Tfp pilus assembly protein PilF
MRDDALHNWKIAGLVASVAVVLAIPAYVAMEMYARARRAPVTDGAQAFVGRAQCVDCHTKAYAAWLGSDHDRSMAVANDSTVLGDFDGVEYDSEGVTARFFKKDGKCFVRTEGPGGVPEEFEVTYIFGVEPLQQYLVAFPGGRLQALRVAWDTERNRWFHMYPGEDIPADDWLHWTRGAQNWNGMCAECHSTNLIKNYDPETKTFDTTWSEIDVSCEACHGPGSRHVEWAELPPMARPLLENYGLVIDTGDISARQQVELCAPCHSRRTELGDYDHTRADLLDNIVPSVLEEALYFADGQIEDEVYVYGSFVQSKMFRNDVRCGDCHDVHSLARVKDGNDLCLQCHQVEVYDSYDHHFHKKEHEGKPSDGYLCVKCHMPERPYMVVDWRADHSIRVPRPDLALEIGVPNACNQPGCHDDKSAEWAAEHHQKWYGIARKPHYGTVLAAGRARAPDAPDARDPLIRLADNQLQPAIVRATALTLLAAYPSRETTAAFNRALSDGEPLVRYTAVVNINTSDPEELVTLVSPLLFDAVRAVCMQAAVALAGIPDELLEPYQVEALAQTLSEYRNAMEYSLDFAFAGHNLGNLYARLGDAATAESYYESAIEIDDLFYPAKINLAMLYNSQRRNAEAEKLLREVLDEYPDQHEIAYSLGLLLVEMNRFEDAAAYLARAANGIPGRPRIVYNLGLLQQQLGREREAEASLSLAVEIEPENLDYLYALADHYIKRGMFTRAGQVADRMIAAHPDNRLGHDIKNHVEKTLRSTEQR